MGEGHSIGRIVLDLDTIRTELARAPDAHLLRPIGLRELVLGVDVLGDLPDVLARAADPGTVAGIADATPMTRAGRDLKATVAELGAAFVSRWLETPEERGQVHADERTVETLTEGAAGARCVLSVGSGTVTDIAKAVARALGAAHVAVQTAASVNGFADDQSVLLVDGVKRTVSTQWPVALVVDAETLVEAPPAMTAAGVGDLVSMYTAAADWFLACLAGVDGSFSDAVVRLCRGDGDDLAEVAPRVRERSPEALLDLAGLLTLTGLAIGVAGGTAPSSGMEHTVSHLVEMRATARGERAPLHGAAVGVCTVLATLYWLRLADAVVAAGARLRVDVPGETAVRERILGAFAELDPSGRMGAECWEDYSRKLGRLRAAQSEVVRLPESLREHRHTFDELLVPAEEVVARLKSAGAPVRFSQLDPPVDSETARWALSNCHLVRDRFTIADLGFLLGLWEPSDVDGLLAEAASVGGGI